jgi:tripeptide aminopeptidase
MANEQRLLNYFLDLVRIDSEAYHEREIADKLTADLKALGLEVSEDDAALKVGSGAGNLIATLKGSVPGAAPIMLCAHMDTVVPGKGVKPQVEDGIVRKAATISRAWR